MGQIGHNLFLGIGENESGDTLTNLFFLNNERVVLDTFTLFGPFAPFVF